MTARFTLNPRPGGRVDALPGDAPHAYHRRLPGYAPSPLLVDEALAADLGVGRLLVKDESERLGLPSFKILGASWAVYRALQEHLRSALEPWSELAELAERLEPARPLVLAAATDGNHGRAVARIGGLLGLEARIFAPSDMAPARIAGIESEGASVTVVDGTYDDAIARSAQEAGSRCLVISDTSWPGYTDVPRWVIEGYSTMLREVDEQLAASGLDQPDLVVVQIGVGALAAAVTAHYRDEQRRAAPPVVGVEPELADCARASVEAGRIVQLPGPHPSIMAGLNCGTPSLIAWPVVSSAIELFMTVDDDGARRAMRDLAGIGVVAGETGAAGLAALRTLMTDSGDEATEVRERLGVHAGTQVLLLCTEGATDPVAYREIVGAVP